MNSMKPPEVGSSLSPSDLLQGAALRRLILALIAVEHRRQFAADLQVAKVEDATLIDEEGLGFDSLGRLALVARLNRFFGLHVSGVEDYLLVQRSFGDWLSLVAEHLRLAGDRLVLEFETSGSTGVPKSVRHSFRSLHEEVAGLASGPLALPAGARVLATVPPQHIYGFLFTILLPAILGAEVVDLSGLAPSATARHARPGDLVVSTPFLWNLILATQAPASAQGMIGLVSTAPSPAELWPRARAAGYARLIEIYGSSETSGIGWREGADESFRLMSHLQNDGEDILRAGSATALPLQDRLVWTGPREFRIAGRIDGVVQVGGVNVSPAHVAGVLRGLPGVADAAVRLDGDRLKAFIVPSEAATPDLEHELRSAVVQRLAAPERPVRFDFGPALPRTALGKLADWPSVGAVQPANLVEGPVVAASG